MTNVVNLFPDPTDEDYEAQILPVVIEALMNISTALGDGDGKTVSPVIAPSLLRYAIQSLTNLELMRRDGVFRDNKLPIDVGWAVDQLAADYAETMGADKEMVEKLRNRTLVRGKTDE